MAADPRTASGERALVFAHIGDLHLTDEHVWTASLPVPAGRLVALTVRATDVTGRPGQHTIRVATASTVPPARVPNGSDAAPIEAWPENGILGTQLGPNRNGAASS